MAANEHLRPAPQAQEEPGWHAADMAGALALRRRPGGPWTSFPSGAIMPWHSCPARCGARR
jgi:hypothetical protein